MLPNPPNPLLNNLQPQTLVELFKNRSSQIIRQKNELQNLNDPISWIQSNFYIPELKGPIKLMPYQQAVLREALKVDANGHYRYSTIIWSDIKKSIKSCIAAAVGLWRGFSTEWGQIYVIANDLNQANSRVGFYMRRAIEMNPLLKATCKIRGYKIILPNNSFIESIPIDPSGEAGSNADMIIFSELWGAHQDQQARMWTEMTLSPTKFGKSFRWIETYAGYTGESPLLEDLYETGVNNGEQIELGIPGLEVFVNQPARVIALWNTQPRCPWQTPDYYQQEAAALQPLEFQRVHRNQWVSSVETFVPMEWWEACKRPAPNIAKDQPMVVAIDAAVSGDCFGLVGVSRSGNQVIKRYAKMWTPPKGGKIDYAEPEKEIRRLAREYNVVEFAYDEYQLHDLATRLGKEGVGWFRKFGQQNDRWIADKQLYDMIRDRRVYHDGDADLTEHVANANAEKKGDNKLRLIKKTEKRHIDLAVCLSMAAAEAMRLSLE